MFLFFTCFHHSHPHFGSFHQPFNPFLYHPHIGLFGGSTSDPTLDPSTSDLELAGGADHGESSTAVPPSDTDTTPKEHQKTKRVPIGKSFQFPKILPVEYPRIFGYPIPGLSRIYQKERKFVPRMNFLPAPVMPEPEIDMIPMALRSFIERCGAMPMELEQDLSSIYEEIARTRARRGRPERTDDGSILVPIVEPIRNPIEDQYFYDQNSDDGHVPLQLKLSPESIWSHYNLLFKEVQRLVDPIVKAIPIDKELPGVLQFAPRPSERNDDGSILMPIVSPESIWSQFDHHSKEGWRFVESDFDFELTDHEPPSPSSLIRQRPY